jgi:hypothetical protein
MRVGFATGAWAWMRPAQTKWQQRGKKRRSKGNERGDGGLGFKEAPRDMKSEKANVGDELLPNVSR